MFFVIDKLDKYLQYCAEIRGATAATLRNKRNGLTRFFEWLGEREFNLDSSREYISFLLRDGKSTATIRQYFKIILAFAAWLDRYGYQKYQLKALELPKVIRKERAPISTETGLKVIGEGCKPCSSDNKSGRESKEVSALCLRFMLFTGCRDGGTLGMKAQDIHFDSSTYHIRLKGGRLVEKGLPLNLIGELKEYSKNKTGKLFPVYVDTLRRVLRRGCKILGIPKITPHDLRRIFATTLAQTGISPIQLAKQLNHAKVETTYQYYVSSDVFKDAEILNLSHPQISQLVDARKKLEMVEKSQTIGSLLCDPRFKVTLEAGRLTIEEV